MENKSQLKLVVMAILAGLGGELHVMFSALGTIAMLDLVSYCISIPIIFLNWNRMGKYMRRSMKFAFFWTVASMIANLFVGEGFKFWLKCVSLASSSWAIMVVAYLILRSDARLYLWYLVGAGIGGWIALYYFRNGALEYFAAGGADYFGQTGGSVELLMEKQIYPSIAKGVCLGLILPVFIWWRRAPFFFVVTAFILCGFWLLMNGGSRSNFGIFIASAAAGFFVVYARNLTNRILHSPMIAFFIMMIGVCVVFLVYQYMASSGVLGESELNKYQNEFGEDAAGVLEGRASFSYALRCFMDSYGLGAGACLRCHSVIANSLACEGIIGFLFWVYFYLQCLWFICKRLPYSGSRSLFIMLMILSAAWDVFGSPFGTRHKFFVLMAFIALCRDNEFYGYGDVFGEKSSRGFFVDYSRGLYL